MCLYLQDFENVGYKLCAYLNGFNSHTDLFNKLIPDIVLVRKDKLTVIELKCSFETNFEKSTRCKINQSLRKCKNKKL